MRIGVYTFFDRDKSGDYLRKMMRRTYSEAVQLVLPVQFNGVAEAPTMLVLIYYRQLNFK